MVEGAGIPHRASVAVPNSGTSLTAWNAPVTVTTEPYLPRAAWSTHDTVNWMLADEEGLPEVLARLRKGGVPEVAVVMPLPGPGRVATTAGYGTVEEVDEPGLSVRGLGLFLVRP